MKKSIERQKPQRECRGGIPCDENYTKPGAVLRELRRNRGMTRPLLAQKIHMSAGEISEIEDGKRSLDRDMAYLLSGIFGAQYTLFLYGKQN